MNCLTLARAKMLEAVGAADPIVLDCGCSPEGPCPKAARLFARTSNRGALILHLSHALDRTLRRARNGAP